MNKIDDGSSSMNMFLQRVHHIDTLAFLWLHVTKGFRYRRSIRWISRSGDGPLYAAIGLLLFFLEPTHGKPFFIAAGCAYALDVSLYLLLKNLIKRDRPAAKIDYYQAWITPSDKFSFPSGHTAAAFVFAWLVWSFYPIFTLPLFVWASLVGLSRVLLGVHYPSDIIAGGVLGSGCAFSGIYLQQMMMGL
jgi:undecaprenyl-diphosphatase